MSLFAANNIKTAVDNFQERGYATVKGIILNCRNVPDEYEKVKMFSDDKKITITGIIPRCNDINIFEEEGKTLIEGNINHEVSKIYMNLAKEIMK
jgi:nitrogenase iron protein NifH